MIKREMNCSLSACNQRGRCLYSRSGRVRFNNCMVPKIERKSFDVSQESDEQKPHTA